MKYFISLITGAVLSFLPLGAFANETPASNAVMNPLSVHVLNLQDGLPSPDVSVTLEKQEGDHWTMLSNGVTNAQGRIPALYPQDKAFEAGTYRVTFKTGEWFTSHKAETFFPEIPVIFKADGNLKHYHIPLLLSPFGYSTYRGN